MNIFQLPYEDRLQDWHNLKEKLKTADIKTKCVEIDNWWQKAPVVNHHIHLMDSESWPNPWELLAENIYCNVAKSIGMCYTLLLIGVDDVSLVEAIDNIGNETVLVLVDSAKYILNYWPNTVVNNSLQDFTIKRHIDIDKLKQKIR